MRVIWTQHATERQQQWQKKLDISPAEVEAVVTNPGQIVPGDAGTFIAQTPRGNGLLRVAFSQLGDDRKILTIYWTSRVAKYWKGE